MAPRRLIREKRACWNCWSSFTARAVDVVFCSTRCGDEWRAVHIPTDHVSATRLRQALNTTTTTRPAMAGREG